MPAMRCEAFWIRHKLQMMVRLLAEDIEIPLTHFAEATPEERWGERERLEATPPVERFNQDRQPTARGRLLTAGCNRLLTNSIKLKLSK